jgi:endo-1,4-beta-xylanase
MSEEHGAGSTPAMNRRSFLRSAAALMAGAAGLGTAQTTPAKIPDTSALKRAARQSGKLLAMFTGGHELQFDPTASAIIANTFSMIANGNDLKFTNRLRPTPDTYNFGPGDYDVDWAASHGLLFRGHNLLWWNALPNWFQSFVTPSNAHRIMTEHITTVVGHYAGKVYSWDVVNEPIHHDNRADGLRIKPWLDLIGPDYIDIAFRVAAAADPKAKLILNECFIEHDTPAEVGRRAALLALVTRLKKADVPITGIGVQGHLRGTTPLDKPGMTTFLKQVHDLGLEIMVTELDVDDIDIPGPLIDETVARKYGEFLDLMGPYVKVVTFEQLRDDPGLPKRSDGLMHRPNLFDSNYQPTLAYSATVTALHGVSRVPKRNMASSYCHADDVITI